MIHIDPNLEIEDRLSPDDQALLLERATRADPELDGAQVADILSIYSETEALPSLIEPFYGSNRDLYENVDAGLIRAAVIAAAIIRPDEMRPVVEQLMAPPPIDSYTIAQLRRRLTEVLVRERAPVEAIRIATSWFEEAVLELSPAHAQPDARESS